MTKFGKSGKTGPSGFLFQSIRFRQISAQEQDVSYIQRFEDPRSFEAWKGLKSIKKSIWKKSKLEAEVTKIGLSDFGYRSIRFSRTDRVRVGIEI
jgi:hypothetical protein